MKALSRNRAMVVLKTPIHYEKYYNRNQDSICTFDKGNQVQVITSLLHWLPSTFWDFILSKGFLVTEKDKTKEKTW